MWGCARKRRCTGCGADRWASSSGFILCPVCNRKSKMNSNAFCSHACMRAERAQHAGMHPTHRRPLLTGEGVGGVPDPTDVPKRSNYPWKSGLSDRFVKTRSIPANKKKNIVICECMYGCTTRPVVVCVLCFGVDGLVSSG